MTKDLEKKLVVCRSRLRKRNRNPVSKTKGDLKRLVSN